MKDGERGWPIEKCGKKEQKEWLDNTLPDPHPCTAGNEEEEHNTRDGLRERQTYYQKQHRHVRDAILDACSKC